MKDLKVIRHKFVENYPIVVVENLSTWANGNIASPTYYQKVKFAGRPLKFVVIESSGAKDFWGYFNESIVGVTMAMMEAHKLHPRNPRTALKWAIHKTMEFEDREENSSSDWKSPYQQDKPGDEARPGEWDKIKDMMDQELEAETDVELDETIMEAGKSERKSLGANVRDHDTGDGEKKPKNNNDTKSETDGYTHKPGGDGNLYVQGKDIKPATLQRKDATHKLVDGKMQTITGDEAKQQSQTQPGGKQQDTNNQETGKKPRVVTSEPIDSPKAKAAIKKRDQEDQATEPKRANKTSASANSTSIELNVPYPGDKKKIPKSKIAAAVSKSEAFTRDNGMSDAEFSEQNADNWLSDEYRLTFNHSIFKPTAIAKTSLQVLERMINTNRGGKNAPTGERAKAAYYNGDVGGAGQALSQAGELMMLTFMSVDDDEIDEFYNAIEEFIDENDDRSVLTKDWLIAARQNRDTTRKHLDAKYGDSNWEIQSSGWDTEEEFKAMYGLDYKENKGFSTDTFFSVLVDGKPQMLEVSLKKSLDIFFLNSGPEYFTTVDESLKGGPLDVNVFSQAEKTRTKKAMTKTMAKNIDTFLKTKPKTKLSKELAATMKKLKVKSVAEFLGNINWNNQDHRKLVYKAMGVLAESGNKGAKKFIDETLQAYQDFSDNGIREIQDNKQLNEGIMGRIRKEFPLKSVAGSEEIMALGDQMVDRATMKEMFGTNDADKIMESLKVYKNPDGSAFLGYAAGVKGEPIPVAKIRLRGAGQGYTGRIKFDFEMHPKFKKIITAANEKVYGNQENDDE